MQLKINRSKSLGQSLLKTLLKSVIGLALIFVLLFFIEKINFPAPKNKFEIDISNEIIKIK